MKELSPYSEPFLTFLTFLTLREGGGGGREEGEKVQDNLKEPIKNCVGVALIACEQRQFWDIFRGMKHGGNPSVFEDCCARGL